MNLNDSRLDSVASLAIFFVDTGNYVIWYRRHLFKIFSFPQSNVKGLGSETNHQLMSMFISSHVFTVRLVVVDNRPPLIKDLVQSFAHEC